MVRSLLSFHIHFHLLPFYLILKGYISAFLKKHTRKEEHRSKISFEAKKKST